MANKNVQTITDAIKLPGIATADAPTGVEGLFYYDSDLEEFQFYAGGTYSGLSGTAVAAGVAGRLSLYPASGSQVDDVYVQNSQNITVNIVAQPTRSAPITYVIPNPGDAVTSADLVLTEGAQTINGNKTFGNDVVITGDLTVNGTTTTISTTNTLVEDKLITLNDGGAAASGGGSGIEIEEDSSITGYFKTSAARTGFEMKAPATAGVATFVTNASSFTYTLPGHSGTVMTDVVDDTSPQLGGELDVNGNAIASASNGAIILAPHGTGKIRYAKQGALTRYVDEVYVDAVTLTASTTAVASAFTFDSKVIKSQILEYQIVEATTFRRRAGRLLIVADGDSGVAASNVSVTGLSGEAGGDVGVTWSVAMNGDNAELSYTTTANNKTLQAMVKRFLA